MGHLPLQRITDFLIVGPYTLHLSFADGMQQTINFEPVLHGELFGPLRDLTIFNQVRLDREWDNLIWPNDAEFDPAILHNWAEDGPYMIRMAKKWQTELVMSAA